MCLINFSIQSHQHYKLIITANRDEMYERPTAPAQFWNDYPQLLAGRDLQQMGTWLGITKQGRFAALTNFRDPKYMNRNALSRGNLVKDYLVSQIKPEVYLQKVMKNKRNYNGFNLVVGDVDHLYYFGSEQDEIIPLEKGTHSLSNHLLNTPWPKVEKSKDMLHHYVSKQENPDLHAMFKMLTDRTIAQDEHLPDTGVGLELERQLSPIFIQMPNYGTRSSSIILVSKQNEVTFIERTYNQGKHVNENKFNFTIN